MSRWRNPSLLWGFLAAYLLLFEVWPRYLFVYAPLFVVLAALGLERLALPPRRTPAGGTSLNADAPEAGAR